MKKILIIGVILVVAVVGVSEERTAVSVRATHDIVPLRGGATVDRRHVVAMLGR